MVRVLGIVGGVAIGLQWPQADDMDMLVGMIVFSVLLTLLNLHLAWSEFQDAP